MFAAEIYVFLTRYAKEGSKIRKKYDPHFVLIVTKLEREKTHFFSCPFAQHIGLR